MVRKYPQEALLETLVSSQIPEASITRELFSLNNLIGENEEVNAKTLPKAKDAEPRRIHHPLPGHVEGVLILRPVGKTWDY